MILTIASVLLIWYFTAIMTVSSSRQYSVPQVHNAGGSFMPVRSSYNGDMAGSLRWSGGMPGSRVSQKCCITVFLRCASHRSQRGWIKDSISRVIPTTSHHFLEPHCLAESDDR